MKNQNTIRYPNQSFRPRRVRNNNRGIYILFTITAALVVLTIILGIATFIKSKKDLSTDEGAGTTPSSVATETDENGNIIIPNTDTSDSETTETTVDPATIPAPNQNPLLFPATVRMDVAVGTPQSAYSPSGRGTQQDIYHGQERLSSYQRESEIHMGDPLNYQSLAGILTFRGNNFRNCASWGYADIDPTKPEGEHFEKVWEFTELKFKSTPLSSSWSWVGVGWTGQALAVRWGYDMQQQMNMYPDKKSKENLTEIIIASQDGHVYFLDLDDGQKTRDPLNVGATIKGTPAVDPRGYPILYVGQGDDNGTRGEIGWRIYSLLNFELLYFQTGLDPRAHRTTWGACDSSPIIDANSDTLIYPSENGMIYTVKLNTQFNPDAGTVTVNPDTVAYRYIFDGVSGSQLGIESSIAIYDHYGWCTDNAGNLICVDLNTLTLVWSRRLDDDSDVTPVIEEENGHVYLYTGTEVDWQKDELEYQGQSFTYKIDAMTGEEVWCKTVACYTKNGTSSSDDINGGMLGNPIIGKKSIDNLVIFSYSMTKNTFYGNALVAYDKETGNEVWRYDWNTYTWSSPVDIYDEEGNPYIVVFDSQAQGHLVDGKTGVRIGLIQGLKQADYDQLTNFEAAPIVVDNMIVISQRSTAIYGIKVS
ncbi:MAG: PQQ-binding-like beta-propeller repeat protein [Clostridiales bacterium]|nr:PQQ-binding-like beta-propeller repeat protein [Clostridiales bacterium]